MDRILEARHFAELFDWQEVRKRCEVQLERLLVSAGTLEIESLLAVVEHAEESMSLPSHLKAAALAAAVRQWSRVAESAAAMAPQRRAELSTLSRIHQRDGHVCQNLEEYLHAAADDLLEWERALWLNAPIATKRKIEMAWEHWLQILYEFGHINSAASAERWRAKVLAQRDACRKQRVLSPDFKLPEGKVWFDASIRWQEVPPDAVCPGGLEYRINMETGRNWAKIPT